MLAEDMRLLGQRQMTLLFSTPARVLSNNSQSTNIATVPRAIVPKGWHEEVQVMPAVGCVSEEPWVSGTQIFYSRQKAYLVFAQERETLPSLYWTVNKLAFFPEEGTHYLYFASVFTIEISLERPSRTKVVTAFSHPETWETHGELSPNLFIFPYELENLFI